MIKTRKFRRLHSPIFISGKLVVFEEIREFFESEVGYIKEGDLPTPLKKLGERKIIWEGFNDTPDYDKNFPMFEEEE